MNIDFTHNQIIRDTVTDSFMESFNENLVPYLVSEYGSALSAIQFYDDHLTEGLRINGEFFYPLTVVVGGVPEIRFVKWQVSNYRNYDKFNPFTYKGKEMLDFELVDEPTSELLAITAGKRIYAAEGVAMPVILSSTSEDKTFLAGKYSQSFVDLLGEKITAAIERELSVSGLATSGVVLELRFEPGTFMEHIAGNTTYRRVLIKARGCAARDLWIKWTRLDGAGVYTVSDNVPEGAIDFALAEDVPGKIREKEYRYLTTTDTARYQAAMSRKNVTEWREVMRRVIRRGELTPLTETETLTPPAVAPEEEIVYTPLTAEPAAVEAAPTSDLDALLASLDIEEDTEEHEEVDEELEALLQSAIGLTATPAETEEHDAFALSVEDESEVGYEKDEPDGLAEEHEDETEVFAEQIAEEPEEESVIVETIYTSPKVDEERIRYEIEAKLRAEMEEKLRRKEQEAEELRARLEAKERAEERERQLLAESAREALLEKERIEREAREREALEREAAEKRAEEQRRAEEAARLERERAEEAARLKAEAEAKERAEAEARKKAEGETVSYVSKTVKLFFKQQIDTEITKRIHEIILATIKYYHKEDVYIKIKANIPDITTAHLEFVKIPEAEIPLLVNIIKVLGRSGLGITRAILD